MDNNNINFVQDNQETLPQFNTYTQSESNGDINFIPESPVFVEEHVAKKDKRHPEVDKLVDDAFTKGIIATVLIFFPICSIIAIFIGKKSYDTLNKAQKLSEEYDVGLGGKATAAKILCRVGLYGGIVTSVSYIFEIIAAIISFFGFLFFNLIPSFFNFFSDLRDIFDILFQFSEVY